MPEIDESEAAHETGHGKRRNRAKCNVLSEIPPFLALTLEEHISAIESRLAGS
jgi:uncharacterized MAPEG superfamily protein